MSGEKRRKHKAKKTAPIAGPLQIDIGCGPNKKDGYVGLDQYAFAGVDHVLDLGSERWPFEDGSVDTAHASHFVEHLNPQQRCHFYNELWRVLKVGGQATIIVPHWGSTRAYGDPTHAWPPVSEMSFYYLDRKWRETQAPHTDAKYLSWGFSCHFQVGWGYTPAVAIRSRNVEYQQYAINHLLNAADDAVATLTKLE